MSTLFHRTPLVRILADLALLPRQGPGDAFAEKLAQWIDIAGAIALRASHQTTGAAATPATPATHTAPAAPVEATPPDASVLQSQLDRLRHSLTEALALPDFPDAPALPAASLSVASRPAFSPSSTATPTLASSPKRPAARPGLSARGRHVLVLPGVDAPLEWAASFAPFRRYYLAQQREWELKLAPLRAQARSALAAGSAPMRQLAALDAALEQSLAPREAQLLASVPRLLEDRFTHLHRSHQQRLTDAGQEDRVALWLLPEGWMRQFCHELHSVLLAELDLRLQPSIGLLQALQASSSNRL